MRRLTEARGRIALLSLAAPEENPLIAVKQKLLERIRAEKSASSGLWHVSKSRQTIRWWNTIWAPAAIGLVILSIFLWYGNRQLDSQLENIRQQIAADQKQIQHSRSLVAMLTAQDTMTIKLEGTQNMPKAWGTVKYNPRMQMMCYSADLPEPPPKMVYQMWAVPEVGDPVSEGIFMPETAGEGKMPMAKVPSGMSCKWFCVTIEPEGGKQRPTGPRVLVGTL
ncbi:MAG TPA: anti-sigma factor [Candidatus Acidoferrales bacterium]|nr:anti-sigma factor [Candidatus Acidoferrales bacterium]